MMDTHSLKVDWTGKRINAVRVVLNLPDIASLGPNKLAAVRAQLLPMALPNDAKTTVKLFLSEDELNVLELALALGGYLLELEIHEARRGRSATLPYPSLVEVQAEAFGAVQDIHAYRKAVAVANQVP